jgi:hypothetical protein
LKKKTERGKDEGENENRKTQEKTTAPKKGITESSQDIKQQLHNL